MSQYLIYRLSLLTTCYGLLSSCGEKPVETSNAETENKANPTEKLVSKHTSKFQFVELSKDGTETDVQNSKQLKLEVTAEIYDAPALPLGEMYSSKKQLVDSTQVARFINTSYSGMTTELDAGHYQFYTEPLIGELGQIIDLDSKVKFYDLEMKFSTTMKFRAPLFYEMSMADNPDRVFVISITAAQK